jgi:hypothetical protein
MRTFNFGRSVQATPATPTSGLPRRSNSVEPDQNALVIPESMVKSQRGNEQLHVIVGQNPDQSYSFRFATYVNGGVWKETNGQDAMWFGYVSAEKSRPPVLTTEGIKLLAQQLNETIEVLNGSAPQQQQA